MFVAGAATDVLGQTQKFRNVSMWDVKKLDLFVGQLMQAYVKKKQKSEFKIKRKKNKKNIWTAYKGTNKYAEIYQLLCIYIDEVTASCKRKLFKYKT